MALDSKAAATKCWGSHVSTCGGGQSLEHMVSYGAFTGSMVEVRGLGGGDAPARTVPVKTLGVNALCRDHNRALSPIDQAGIDTLNCFRRMAELRPIRERGKPGHRWRTCHLVVDGLGFERWILKTVINAAVSMRKRLEGWHPPPGVAEFIFGGGALPEGAGIYHVGAVGDRIEEVDRWTIFFGQTLNDSEPTAALVSVRGFRFLAAWSGDAAALGRGFHVDGRLYAPSDLMRHPLRMDFGQPKHGLSVQFDYSGRWAPARHREVVKLRARYPAPPR